METEGFLFPYYFRNLIGFYFYLCLSPFRFAETKGSEVIIRSDRIQKAICIGFQILVVLFGIVVITSFSFINLKKYPTQLFTITNESFSFITTLTVLYIFWVKQKELQTVAEISIGKIKRSTKWTFFVAFILYPVWSLVCEVIVVLKTFNDSELLDRTLRLYLNVVYITPAIGTLETWQRVVGLILYIGTRYSFIVSTFGPMMVLFGGLALKEINTRLLELVNERFGDCQLLPPIINIVQSRYLSKTQSVIQALMTVHVITSYSALSRELVLLSQYPKYKMAFTAVQIAFRILILLQNAESTVIARKVQKKILLCDDRIQYSNTFSAAEVDEIKNSYEFGASGFISVIDYGSLGLAFGVIVQFAIIMLQFLQVEGTSNA